MSAVPNSNGGRMPRYAVYPPPSPDLPHLAVVIDNGQVVACEPVPSTVEGEALLREVEEVEPQFLTEAGKARH
jgi:hypothetical protein